MGNLALDAYAGRTDLQHYGSNGLLLFAIQLYFKIEDIDPVAASALTDGADDKKCDLVYFDTDRSTIVIAQGYMAQSIKTSAKANKASDLNTAVSWILNGNLDHMPASLQSAAIEVRQALEDDRVEAFEVWYVHNLEESENVAKEMATISYTAKDLIKKKYPSAQVNSISAREVGQNRLEDWYRRTEVPIVVSDTFTVPAYGGFWEISEKWSAFCASVPAMWLYELWQKHGPDLFSPNVRDYLGVRRSEKNINYGIQKSVRATPEQFWIFNNGVTIIVNDMSNNGTSGGEYSDLMIEGLGIVNGAQTTGTIGSLQNEEKDNLAKVRVMARFVKCSDPEILRDVVRFNNTQNKVEASDFRSNDDVQERLRHEFESVPDAEYRGARRGGAREVIERKRNLIADKTAAQALAAFHGRPNLAYNDTRRIWVDDGIYAQHFSDRTTARHIVMCVSLLRAIEKSKEDIASIDESDRTDAQKKHMDYFRRRGSLHVLASAISGSIESIIGRAVPDKYRLRFKENCSPKDASTFWTPIVSVCLSLSAPLSEACDRGLQNGERVRSALEQFSSLMEATKAVNESLYADFASRVEYVE